MLKINVRNQLAFENVNNHWQFSKNSTKISKKIPWFWKYPIPYIALRGRKPFWACFLIKSDLILPDNLTLQVKLSTFITLMTKTRTRRQLSTKNQTIISWSTFICILPCYFYSWIKLFIYHLLQKNIKVMKIIVKSHLDWRLFKWSCGFWSL